MTEPFLPLQGYRVVEMTHMIMGPSCGMFLALMGAAPDVLREKFPRLILASHKGFLQGPYQ